MFAKVLNQMKQGEYPKGLSQETIDMVSAYCEEHFGCPLPSGYAMFLKQANGFSYDGHSIFCCYNNEIQTVFPKYTGFDFVTFNTKFYVNTDISSYLVLGKSSIDYVCFEKATGKYVIMTNGTMQHITESDDLDVLLESFFGL